MKLFKHFTLIARGIKLMHRLNPVFTWFTILIAIVDGLKPFPVLYFSAKIIDALYVGEELSRIVLYAGLTVGLSFLLSILGAYMGKRNDFERSKLHRNELWMYSEKAMELAYESIEDRNVELLRKSIQEESRMGWGLYSFHNMVSRFTRNSITIITSLSMTASFFSLDSVALPFKLMLVVGVLLISIYTVISTAKMAKLDGEYVKETISANIVSDRFYSYTNKYSACKDVRLYDLSEHMANHFHQNLVFTYHLSATKAYKKLAHLFPGSILTDIFKFSVYAILIMAALSGEMSVGSIAKYLSCIMLLMTNLTGLVGAIQKLFTNNIYLEHFFSYFDIPNNMYKGSLTLEKREDNEYSIEFRNVSFKYPNSDVYALRHIDFKFKIGEKLAIVGMNGSGKTTFIKLLCRLYDPTEGEILLNGINIQKYDYNEYMQAFSVVFQDFGLYDFTLGQNVAASNRFDKEKATRCLKMTGFGERLETMPNGLDTYLYKGFNKDGIEISGGERQKIALARALYKDAPFIILDEPTAALDPVSEYEIYSKFNEIAGDKTTVYISHRLASCRFCDKIAVFDEGRIVQSGSHETLITEENGKYYELWNAQAQYYVK